VLGVDLADILGTTELTMVLFGVVESVDSEAGTFQAVGQSVTTNLSIVNALNVGEGQAGFTPIR